MLDPNKNKNENWVTEFNNFQKQIEELKSAEDLKQQAALPKQKTGVLAKVCSYFNPKLTGNEKLGLAMTIMSDGEKIPPALATAWKEEEAEQNSWLYLVTDTSRSLLEVYRKKWTDPLEQVGVKIDLNGMKNATHKDYILATLLYAENRIGAFKVLKENREKLKGLGAGEAYVIGTKVPSDPNAEAATYSQGIMFNPQRER